MISLDSNTKQLHSSTQARQRFASRYLLYAGIVVALTWANGCSADKPPPDDTASQPADVSIPEVTPPTVTQSPQAANPSILPGLDSWTFEEAVAKLSEESARLSAALRLLQLSELAPFGTIAPLPAPLAERLRIVALDESHWALGLQTCNEYILAAIVLIAADGAASYPTDYQEPEFTYLHYSENIELFPHLFFAEDRLWMWGDGEWNLALTVKRPAGLHFEKRSERGRPSVVLMWQKTPIPDPGKQNETDAYVEIARYRWDPFELAFAGPLCDKLPDPPGGQFELDLELSEALIPIGGVLPEPPKFEPRPAIPQENRPPPY